MVKDFLNELHAREQLHQTTGGEHLEQHLGARRVGYAGFDPSSNSLTIGNFIPIKILMHWQQCGHRPIVLMGGGTGLIGDPSGKDAERQLLSREQVEANIAGQRKIFERFLDFDPKNPAGAILVNNADWLGELGYLDVLRDVGKHFSVNAMIQRDSVRDRLHAREQGISYTEFSYMILQAYDFLHLHRQMDCTVQMAGSDQFGNIVSGIDLIRRDIGHGEDDAPAAYAVTVPLIVGSDGKKIGKTEKGAVWLSADRTSPYAFYQYWINIDDRDAVKFLRWFTLKSLDEVEAIGAKHEAAPHERHAQRELARYLTDLVHGASEREHVEAASRALFSGEVAALDGPMLEEVFGDVPSSTHAMNELEGEGVELIGLLAGTSLAKSKREAREFLQSGAVAVNGRKVTIDHRLTMADLLHGKTILLKRGKKSWHATRWEN